jgi:hypothetical protein
MTRTRTAAVGVALVGAAALAAAAAVQPASAQDDGGLRAATAIAGKYASEQRALDHGFLRTDMCVSSPIGFMGFHYVNPERLDRRLEPGRPEAVLYKRGGSGTRVLTGIEYIVVDADGKVATDDDRPSLWGHEFDGPMPGHGPGMPVHYDLHVWTHEPNPRGAWSAWNSSTSLSC